MNSRCPAGRKRDFPCRFRSLCFWFFVSGSLFLVLCFWFFVSGSLFLVLCFWFFVSGLFVSGLFVFGCFVFAPHSLAACFVSCRLRLLLLLFQL
jgi:hypothetical protein